MALSFEFSGHRSLILRACRSVEFARFRARRSYATRCPGLSPRGSRLIGHALLTPGSTAQVAYRITVSLFSASGPNRRDRSGVGGMAPRQRMQPTPGGNSRCQSNRGLAPDDENTSVRAVCLGATICRLNGPDTEGPLHRRQGSAWHYNPRRGRTAAKCSGAWRYRASTARSGRKGQQCKRLAASTAQAQAAKAPCRGGCEQDCAHCLEAYGDRRALPGKQYSATRGSGIELGEPRGLMCKHQC